MERSLKARSPGGPPSLAQAQARFNVQGCAESNPASNDSVHPEHFELRWVLQPIVDSRNPRAICAEALVRATRMDDGSGQPVVTQDMIVAMERAGTIQELDQWMLLSVLNWIESNLSQFCTPIGFFSINISAKTLSDHPVALRMVDDFSSYPLDVRQKVCLEITETAKIEDIEQAGRIIGSLKALGAQVALDDFGEGYATKETLARLPVDLLKLSRRYSHEVSNADGYERVRSLCQERSDSGTFCVAEQVEKAGDATLLVRAGVRYLQGYLFGRPDEAQHLLAGLLTGALCFAEKLATTTYQPESSHTAGRHHGAAMTDAVLS